MSALRLIVGLGNPGTQYERSRHNAGAWFVNALAAARRVTFRPEAKLFGEAAKLESDAGALWLLKPTTFMNRSAQSVSAALRFFKIEPEQMLVAHDDLDLSPGTARLKFDGGHGGQNGLRDIQAQLGHGRYHRLRLGIGHPGHKDAVTTWVLGRPGKDDEISILRAIDDALAVVPLVIAGDFNAAMKQLHTRRE
ncbi:MAG TPA: aminoacyl-tRNA hydrolase [Chiayiivirga sp.]|nr:aminoacyl-tRNA hydrolase [Chiayiivirga sp.]